MNAVWGFLSETIFLFIAVALPLILKSSSTILAVSREHSSTNFHASHSTLYSLVHFANSWLFLATFNLELSIFVFSQMVFGLEFRPSHYIAHVPPFVTLLLYALVQEKSELLRALFPDHHEAYLRGYRHLTHPSLQKVAQLPRSGAGQANSDEEDEQSDEVHGDDDDDDDEDRSGGGYLLDRTISKRFPEQLRERSKPLATRQKVVITLFNVARHMVFEPRILFALLFPFLLVTVYNSIYDPRRAYVDVSIPDWATKSAAGKIFLSVSGASNFVWTWQMLRALLNMKRRLEKSREARAMDASLLPRAEAEAEAEAEERKGAYGAGASLFSNPASDSKLV